MKIGVFGDSFADRFMYRVNGGIADESWLQYLEDQGHHVEGYGLSGTSTWYSFEKFLVLHEYMDAIVFVYSHYGRIHSMPKQYIPFASFTHRVEELAELRRFKARASEDRENIMTIVKAANLTSNSTFDLFVQHKIFEEVNKLCREKNIKLVNILPFEDEDSIKDFELKSAHGDCLYDLIPVVDKEMEIQNGTDPRQCHLSLENNTILGKVIVESLNSNSPTNINLSKEVNFVYSEEITNRYIARNNLLEAIK
jgi:hypothetical protein